MVVARSVRSAARSEGRSWGHPESGCPRSSRPRMPAARRCNRPCHREPCRADETSHGPRGGSGYCPPFARRPPKIGKITHVILRSLPVGWTAGVTGVTEGGFHRSRTGQDASNGGNNAKGRAMDSVQFDRWTRTLAIGARSRRGVLRLIGGGGLAVVALGSASDAALACRKDGKPCATNKKNGDCCSGTCKKGTCRPNKRAGGCTTARKNSCDRNAGNTKCPRKNGSCFVLDNGQPYCAKVSQCVNCRSDADCPRFDGKPSKCIKNCPACRGLSKGTCVR